MDYDRALLRISSLLASVLLPSLPPPYPNANRAGGEKNQAFDVYNIFPGWEVLAGHYRGLQRDTSGQAVMSVVSATPTTGGDQEEDGGNGVDSEHEGDLESGTGAYNGSAAESQAAPPTVHLTPPRPETPYCCSCFPMTFNACSFLRSTLFLLAFFQIIAIHSMHYTYVIGGVNGNNWESDPISVTLSPIEANVNVTQDGIASLSERFDVAIPGRTQPLTCLGATIASYSETNTYSLEPKDSLLIKISDENLNWMENVNLEVLFETNETSTITSQQYYDFYSSYDYYFSPTSGIMDLPNEILFYDLRVYSLTISKSCLQSGWRRWEFSGQGTGFEYRGSEGGWASGLTNLVGFDVPMVNQVMFGVVKPPPDPPPSALQTDYLDRLASWLTGKSDGETDPSAYLHSSGHLMSMGSYEKWNYDNGMNVAAVTKLNFFWGLAMKLIYLIFTIIAFFFVSSFTAFAVRILTTSGVVIVFPVLRCLRCIGLIGSSGIHMVVSSYPWIGLPINAHTNAARGLGIEQSFTMSIVVPHALKLIIYYSLYSLAQSSISYGIYQEPYPYAMPVGVWGVVMVWEYYSMVIIRGVEGVCFFPKFCFLAFTTFHLYFHCFAYGYSDLAVLPMFFGSLGAMVYCFTVLEVPKHRDGVLSDERPREIWNALAWGEWSSSLPQEYTMFMTLNARYRPLGVEDEDDESVNVEVVEPNGEGGEGSGDEGGEDEGGGEGDEERLLEHDDEEGVEMTMINLSESRSTGVNRRRGDSN